MASVYTHDGLSAPACAGKPQLGSACGDNVPAFLLRFTSVNILFSWSTLLPPLAALLLAAPFVLDLDNGTYRLLWTQSITRRRWIVTKLGMGIAAVVLIALVLEVLCDLVHEHRLDHLNGRMSATTYDAEGIVPIAYALLVFGIAVALGALWRRTVPALMSALLLYIVVRAFVDSWLRGRSSSSATTVTWSIGNSGGGGPSSLNRGLVVDSSTERRSTGHRLPRRTRALRPNGGLRRGHTHAPSSAGHPAHTAT